MELLFESRREITGVSGKVRFFQCKPCIDPLPVLEPDGFIDGAGAALYGSVLRDGGRFRMWYQAWPADWDGGNADRIGYAESDDGLTWHKPDLGLVDVPGSGGRNNLVDLVGHAPSVFIDPAAPPEHRYRATVCTGGQQHRQDSRRPPLRGLGYYTAVSADGLTWQYENTTPQWPSADVITSIYHPAQRRAIVALKVRPRANGFMRRAIWQAEHRGAGWSDMQSALVPDEFDDISAMARGYASGDYYGMGMQPAGSGTVGFLWQFRHQLPRQSGSDYGLFGVVDVSLAYQAGRGERWLQVPGRPDFIGHADPPWGGGCVYTASCPVEAGDEHRLYFCAGPDTHGWYLDADRQIDDSLKREMIARGLFRIGVARWPKWRLFGFRGEPRGTLDLNLGRLSADTQLRLNVRCAPGGAVRVEAPDRDGRSLSECIPLTGDSLDAPVAWRDGCILPADPDADCRLRLHLDQAEVFAFETHPGVGDREP